MMNSGLRRLLSGAVALMLLGCSSALADTATVTARKLILREKASSTSDALQTLPKGTKLEVLGKSGSWECINSCIKIQQGLAAKRHFM